jgi:hypothetical protein
MINARLLVDLAQKGYTEYDDLFENLPGLRSESPAILAHLIEQFYRASKIRTQSFVDNFSLVKIAEEFHLRAGTLTDGVRENLQRFSHNAPVLRIAHTADHFAYFAVYAQFIYLDFAAKFLEKNALLSPCQLFFIVDWDDISDKRLRMSQFPDVDREHGALHISFPVPREFHGKIQCAIGKPSRQTITNWLASIEELSHANIKKLYCLGVKCPDTNLFSSRINMIRKEIWEAYDRSLNLSDFNAIFMSRLVNLYWGIPTAFFPMTEVAPLMRKCYEYLLKQYPSLVEISDQVVTRLQTRGISIKNNLRLHSEDFPLWYICPKCQRRIGLKIHSKMTLSVSGQCHTCGFETWHDLGRFSNPNLEEIAERIVPKVLFDELTDIIGWNMSGGVSYEGSTEHILTNSLIAKKLGLAVPPEGVWRPRGIHYGFAEARILASLREANRTALTPREVDALKRAFFGRGSILYYLLAQGVDNLEEMWMSHFRQGRQVFTLNEGKPWFQLVEGDKNLIFQATSQFDPKP